jgi:predicted ATPase/Tfp pilus assembly protein PilF
VPRADNLPAQTSSFVGRASDVERTVELLGSETRVVTLLGPAGIGKTSLATRVAHDVAERFDGVCFVPAAEARSESALVSAVAAALGDSTADVGHAIEARGAVLVVIDNVEQVGPSAAETIARWVRTAPAARFLVTSRERLRIESEACLELEPLDDADAARLFVERAARTRGRYAPDAEEARAVAELVRHLAGNPLAIELAAARTTMFSAVELLARIGERFELLTGGPRDRGVRQSSLRGAIDWSWELLSDAEKRALARCSVFRGGFTLEAAVAVLGAGGMAALESLVDKSLVRRGARFEMSETVREYAAEKLAADAGAARDAHVAFYAAFATARAAELRGPGAFEAVARLRAEVDNVLEAHRRLRATDRERAATVALALNVLLAMRGPIDMQREILDAAVEDAAGASPALRVRALVARARSRLIRGETAGADADATLAHEVAGRSGDDAVRALALEGLARVDLERGRSDLARARIDEALGIRQAGDDRAGEASALVLSASTYIKQGRLDDARPVFERALALQRELGDRPGMMGLLANLGIVHHWQDRDEEAKRSYRAALDLAIALGDRREESVDRINLALLLVDEGDLVEARAEFERALAIQRAAGHRQYVGNTVGSLGSLDLLEGRTADARRRFEESLVIFRELGHRRYEAATHRYLGTTALEEGDLERALASLERAREASDEVGDLASFVLGPLGATLALLGREREAEEAFARARASLEKRGEPRAFVLLELFEGVGLVARGDLAGARAVLARTEKKRLASDARVARRLLASAVARAGEKKAPSLAIGEEARWFRVGEGERVDLSKRRAPRLILRALAELRARAPGTGLTLDDVVAAGWPGERIQAEAAAARAYTAIKTLRELGLGELLVRRDDGYLLDPAARLD